jgi:membrane protease YdiL (CAAX protease family)
MVRTETGAWLMLAAILGSYIALSRLVLLLPFELDAWQAEGPRALGRLAAAGACWLWLRPWIASRRLKPSEVVRAPFLLAAALFLAVPVLTGTVAHGPFTAAVNVVGSVMAGLMEEIVFRALVQRLLARRLGVWAAIVCTTVLFVAYHIGVVAPVWFAYAQIVPASLLLGIVYAHTGNLWLVVALHGAYDGLWELAPVLGAPVSFPVALGMLAAAALLAAQWGWASLDPEGEG